jgi:RND family efflux transporter MFP subunit
MTTRSLARTGRLQIVAIVLTIVAVSALVLGARGERSQPSGGQGTGGERGVESDSASPAGQAGSKQVPVVLTPARETVFETRVVVSGSVEAKRFALVSARIPGTLDDVFVDEGDRVQAGETRLFQTDALKLTKAVAVAKQDLAVAQASVQEKEALLAKDLATCRQAQSDVERYQRLLKSNAVAAQVAEQQGTEWEECKAEVEHTRALVELATAQLEQARLNLTMAEKDLADSLVVAPITGRVSERFREPGEMASAGTPVLRIEDLSVLEVSVFLPAEYYGRILPGQTRMRVRAGAIDLGERPVSYQSPTVHPKLRTFEVKGLVESPPEGVVPGCLAEVTVVVDGRTGVGVPSGAVQTRGGRSVVFTVDQQRAQMVPVSLGREMEGWREVLEGVTPGTPVISMGQTLVEDGTSISIVQEDAA